jgi:hypothetical protein
MKSAKKRRPDQGATWSDESEASLHFFKQGERNAAEEVLAYEREITEGARRRGRGWLLLVVAMVVAVAVGVATARYFGSI